MRSLPPGACRIELPAHGWSGIVTAAAAIGAFGGVTIGELVRMDFAGAALAAVFTGLSTILLVRYIRRRRSIGAIRGVQVDLNTTTPLLGDCIVAHFTVDSPDSQPLDEVIGRLRCEFHGRTGPDVDRREIIYEFVARHADLSKDLSAGHGEVHLPIPVAGPPSLALEDNVLRWFLLLGLRLRGRKILWLDPLEIGVRPITLQAGPVEEPDHAGPLLMDHPTDEAGGVGGSFQLRLDARVVYLGECVKGQVDFIAAEQIQHAVLTVKLAFSTEGLGNPRLEQVASQTAYTGPVRQGQRINGAFSLPISADCPVSLESDIVSVRWEVQVAVGAAGASGRGEVAHASFPLRVFPASRRPTVPTRSRPT